MSSLPPERAAADEPEHTILIPRAGGGRQTTARTAPEPVGGHDGMGHAPEASARGPVDGRAGETGGDGSRGVADAPLLTRASGMNPLAEIANPLLELALPLRSLAALPDVEGLRAQVVGMIGRFQAEARARNIPDDLSSAARYNLCAFLDEAIAGTPWGAGNWSARSLLVHFFNESFGGERFFAIVDRALTRPANHRALLELSYVMLALGFEGRYRLFPDGPRRLAEVRDRIAAALVSVRAPVEPELSVDWRVRGHAARQGGSFQRLWIGCAVAAALIGATYAGASVVLDRAAEPVYAALASVDLKTPFAAAGETPSTGTPRLAPFLVEDIRAGRVAVSDLPDRSIVTLSGASLFASGSADVEAAYRPLLQRIAVALDKVGGDVAIVGHTDDQRPGAGRFHSNWTLSQARAQSVAAVLATALSRPERLSAEGKGDTQPRVPNGSVTGRALNRRVEIIVRAPGVYR